MSHIALLLPDLNGGGAERVFLHLARHFSDQGHNIDLLLAQKKGSLLKHVPNKVNLISLSTHSPRYGIAGLAVTTVFSLMKYLWQEKPDVLLSTITGTNLSAALAHTLSGSHSRLVIREAVTLANTKSRCRRTLMRRLYQRADSVIALTEVMREEMIRSIGVQAGKIAVIPNPIDTECIRRLANEPLEHPWLNNHKHPIILGIGRLTEQKNFETLVKAFSLVIKQRPAQLVILGQGPLDKSLRVLTQKLQITEHVLFAGFDQNPYRWLQKCSVFVLSSKWEGYPNTLLEAIALEKRAVCTRYDNSAMDLAALGTVEIVECEDFIAMSLKIILQLEKSDTSPERIIENNDEILHRYMLELIPNHRIEQSDE